MNYDIYIDGFIGQSDFFSEGFSAKTLRDKLANAPANYSELTVHINSGGGSVIEGFAIYDALVGLGKKVNTKVEGLCGSIATIIAQSNSNGGKRSITKNSTYFIHNPYLTPFGEPLEANDLENLAESLRANEDKIANFYAEKTGQNYDFIKEKMASTAEFTAEQSKELGFVDEIIGEAKAFQVHSINTHGKEYRIAAFINKNQTQNNMDILKEFAKVQNKVDELINKFTPKIKNETKQTSEGVQIYYEGELGINTAVFTDEARTVPAPNGVHTVDGKKYTIADGKVTTVEDVADASAEALKAEIETLKAQLAEKETTLQNATAELTTVKAEKAEAVAAVETVNTEFKNLKAIFTTGNGELKPEFQAFKGDGENTKPNQKLNEKLAAKLK